MQFLGLDGLRLIRIGAMGALVMGSDSQECFITLLNASRGLWQGCDWETEFGRRRLNLSGLRSEQIRLLVEATSGEESLAWAEAEQWLGQVESDARQAQLHADNAVRELLMGDGNEAVALVNSACEIESRYHKDLVWDPLRRLLLRMTGKIIDPPTKMPSILESPPPPLMVETNPDSDLPLRSDSEHRTPQ